MITPGKILYLFKQKFGHGLTTAYYRDIVRKKILQTQPCLTDITSTVEVHTLTSSNDFLNTLWSLKSFYTYSHKRYALCIHDDGSLKATEIETLKYHFPNARIINRQEADKYIEEYLKPYPLLLAWRRSNPFGLKVVDFFLFASSPRILSLDSDILFFHLPKVLIERLDADSYKKNSLNRDWRYGYAPSMEQLQSSVDFNVISEINTGLGLLHRESMVWADLEQYMKIPGIGSHPYGGRSEQTLFALACCKFGFEFLPQDYDVHIAKTPLTVSCRHYVSPIRYLMYNEGMKRLQKSRFLESFPELLK